MKLEQEQARYKAKQQLRSEGIGARSLLLLNKRGNCFRSSLSGVLVVDSCM